MTYDQSLEEPDYLSDEEIEELDDLYEQHEDEKRQEQREG